MLGGRWQVANRAKLCQTPAELIHQPLDAVVVSTPNFTHVQLALDILKAGKHLFLEKPCGVTKEECQVLLKASKRPTVF